MTGQYITLKAREEELVNIQGQIVELQAYLNAANDRKWDLQVKKMRVRDEKRRIKSRLDEDEHVEFGFDAGRRMETKRLR